MSNATLGTWRNPPLAYVVAELVISPYYSMPNVVPALQDLLRVAYPRTIEGQEFVVEGIKPPSTSLMWRLLSSDMRHGVQVGTRSISLHATSYVNSGDFLRRWSVVLDAIPPAISNVFVERAGLRYVDLIVPSGSRPPADYLEDHLQGIIPEGAEPVASVWASTFNFGDNTVNLRAAAPAPKGTVLPADFNALPLQKPRVMVDAETRLNNGSAIGVVDTDCVRTVQRVFSAPELIDIFAAMQKCTSKTFRAALSPVAREEWV